MTHQISSYIYKLSGIKLNCFQSTNIFIKRITRYHVENEVKEGTIICLNFFHFFSKLNPLRKRIYHWTPCIFFYLSINAYQRIEIDSMRSVDNHLPFRNNSMNVVVVFIQFNLEMLLFVQDWNKNSCTKTVKICFPFFFRLSIAITISNSLSCKRPHVHVKKKKNAFHIVFEIPFRKSRSRM